jgi:hypothetical protein
MIRRKFATLDNSFRPLSWKCLSSDLRVSPQLSREIVVPELCSSQSACFLWILFLRSRSPFHLVRSAVLRSKGKNRAYSWNKSVESTLPQPPHFPAFATMALHYVQDWMHSVAFSHTTVTVCPVLSVEYACVITVLWLCIFLYFCLWMYNALQHRSLYIACVLYLYGYLVSCNTLSCQKIYISIYRNA